MRNQVAFRASLACVCLLAACVASARADSAAPRVRPADTHAADTLYDGHRHSVTVAALIEALERSDLIVHIETRWFESHRVRAETRFIARAAGQRYVRISIDARIRGEAAIALLGHELQHAWEIAQARWVIDEAGLAELYGRIGHRAGGGGRRMLRVDTPAGPAIERQVLLELRGSQRGGSERTEPSERLTGAD